MVKKNIIVSVVFIFALSTFSAFALSLESSTFFNQDKMPVLFTCDSKDVSPALSWREAPKKTKSFALILSDPDAPGGTFYHWVLFNLPVDTNSLPEGTVQLPAQASVGKTSWGKQQYNGPCPPKGATHRYIFSLYALNTTLELPKDSDAPTVLNAMMNHIVGEVDLVTYYSR